MIQKRDTADIRGSFYPAKGNVTPFSSNSVRLRGLEWIVVGIVCSALIYLGPTLWERLEQFAPGADYRLSSGLSDDYWLYRRYCKWACSRYETLVIGDSVVRGPHVSEHDTLSHHLNEIAGRDLFANLAVDGVHPAALAGLLKYYGRDISNSRVVLHLNPLWMSSRKLDLQAEKEFNFYHPRLVPQFVPNIPCYKGSFSKRICAVVGRRVSFLSWTSHLRIAYFENMDLPAWTIEHPYENPLGAIMLGLPASEDDSQQEDMSRAERGIAEQDFQWVEPAMSLQWRFFRRTIELLKGRGNTVFVLVGPFNEHVLSQQSRAAYRKMKSEIETWLEQHGVAYYMPKPLPVELYHDASHPSKEGYATLARQLFENQAFQSSVLHAD